MNIFGSRDRGESGGAGSPAQVPGHGSDAGHLAPASGRTGVARTAGMAGSAGLAGVASPAGTMAATTGLGGASGAIGTINPALDPDHPAPITTERLQAWMRDNGYSYFVDSDGDIGGVWDNRIFHFLILGDGSAFQVRGQWNRFGNMDRLETMLDAVNEWNADRIWPKAYLRVRDDGSIVTCTDLTIPLDAGVTEPQLDLQLRCGLATSAAFFDTLENQFPDTLARRP